jgi:site-specific recombinase XerC
VPSIAAVQPVHVATWIEASTRELAAPSVKQRLAALRHLFDWLVNGQVVPVNSAHTVRGPRHVVTSGQTPVLDPAEARALLDSIDVTTHSGLRDRALIGLMVYSFARIGAALGMLVEDVYTQNRRLWVRLREKGGKRHAMPCHHNLEEYLVAYLDGAGLRDDPKGPLFRTIGRGTAKLTRTALPQANASSGSEFRIECLGRRRIPCHRGRRDQSPRCCGQSDLIHDKGKTGPFAESSGHILREP